MKKLLLLFIALFTALSIVGCKPDSPEMAAERLEQGYKNLSLKGFNKFMKHWDEAVTGNEPGFSNYIEINEFYREKALNNNVMGVNVEFYNSYQDGEFVVAEFKESITSAIDGKKVPLDRVLKIWILPLSSNYKIKKVEIMPIPEGAGEGVFN